MDLLKKHYEKIILSIVLLGAVIYAALLLGRINEEQDKIQSLLTGIIQQAPKKVEPIDLTPYQQSHKKLKAPTNLVLSGAHNLVNPVRWQRRLDGAIIKIVTGDEVLRDFVVTKLTPLYFTITFEGVSGAGDSLFYRIGLTDDAAVKPQDRRKTVRTVRVTGRSGDLFRLAQVDGPPDNPTQLHVELLRGEKETITVAKGRDFRRVIGYEMEAKYDPEKKAFAGVRLNPPTRLEFAGDAYKVIAITESEVTIESESTNRRWTIPMARTPGA